uniref:Uncharacterized protein n=1 Tax=mine drainage metagenome TaxID=410659 RepID=E6PKV4_9ZZZZ
MVVMVDVAQVTAEALLDELGKHASL